MRDQEIISELEGKIGAYLQEQGFDLVEFVYRYEGNRLVLRILTDRSEAGITIKECAILNNRIGMMLDEKDLIKDKYTLEVSSPGLDRPLVTKKDFLRCINRPVRFFLNELVSDKIELEGIIKQASDDAVEIETKGGTTEVLFSKIRKAKQIIG